MFIEPNIKGERRGWIEVICGSMFSGKTEELIHRVRTASAASGKALLFKPALDDRYATHEIVSHDDTRAACTPVGDPEEILLLADGATIVGIDEAQFLSPALVSVAAKLATGGTRVIIAGLDMDFRGRPFGPMPALMALAEEVYKLKAVCTLCGRPAGYSHRRSAEEATILIGEAALYEPRCRGCFEV